MELNKDDYYDKTKVYHSKLEKKIQELKLLCNMERMPMFITVAVANSPKKTTYMNDMVLASAGTKLTDDRISELLLYLNHMPMEPPAHIKKAISELTDYVDKVQKYTGKPLDLNLQEDYIPKMKQIVDGGDHMVIPGKHEDFVMEEDFWDHPETSLGLDFDPDFEE